MSELKATTAQEIVRNEKDCDYMDELFGGVKMPPTQVYLKSEADKVIADKYKEIRHSKHRRCLAMARWCESENYTACWYHENSERCEWTEKWHKRWLELAEHYREAK